MKNADHLDRLPARVKEALYAVAEKYSQKGVRLFLFGSFAQNKDRPGSDLDLGVEWEVSSSSQIFSELYKDIMEVPTIRKIDLVDMNHVDEGFRKHIDKDRLNLTNIEDEKYE